MSIALNSATAQKAGYILLTSAMFHANNHGATKLISELRSSIARDMTLPTLLESHDLIETLVYPRFYHL